MKTLLVPWTIVQGIARRATRPALAFWAALLMMLAQVIEPARALAAPGDLDPAFGESGVVLFDAFYAGVEGLALQADGKIVAVGYDWSPPDYYYLDFAVARFNADGSLDTSFGSDGVVITDIGGQSVGSYARDVAVDSSGKIVVAGQLGSGSGDPDFVVVRYNPDGSLDTTFGTGGITSTSLRDGFAHAVALLGDGRIVVAGYSERRDGASRYTVVRYLPDGTLDETFGGDGLVFSRAGGIAYDLAVEANGRIVVGGQPGFTLVRYTDNGVLDPTFGGDGIVQRGPWPDWRDASNIAIQADGKILVTGTTPGPPFRFGKKFVVFRYNGDGTLDQTFGGDGRVKTKIVEGDSVFDVGDSIAVGIDQDQRIVVAGYSGEYASSEWQDLDIAVVRYKTDGTLDITFGAGGKVILNLGDSAWYFEWPEAMVVQPDGKIVVGGGTGSGQLLVRLLAA